MWKTARRVVAKMEFHSGELFPRVGFIVTNLETDSRAVVRFSNKRGTAEQRIKYRAPKPRLTIAFGGGQVYVAGLLQVEMQILVRECVIENFGLRKQGKNDMSLAFAVW
jgi:hypothetical protein